MFFSFPVKVSRETAINLLGELPPTASAVRSALIAKIDEILRNYEPTVGKTKTVEKTETPTESVEAPKKSTRKTSKKSDA